VLNLAGEKPVLLRAGGIPVEEIEALIGPVERSGPVDENPSAPGQLRHHYAPRKPLRIVGRMTSPEPRTGYLLFGPANIPGDAKAVLENLSPAGDLREAAAHFFRALRRLDDDPRVQTICAVTLPAHGLGLAMNERLARAAH
jgi:L-threonylcarbamoyladenylate synthase